MKNRLLLMVGALIFGLCAMSAAQDQFTQEDSDVRSSVGRISLIHGDVSTQRGDSGDWATVVLNQPIVSSDKVSTGAGSRAEVQLDHGNIVRLGDNTLAGIAGLSRSQIQIQVDRGLIDYSVFKGSDAAVEIDTANVAIRPDQRDGVYRIEVNSEGETSVIVRKGSAQISTPQGSTQVEQGQMAIVAAWETTRNTSWKTRPPKTAGIRGTSTVTTPFSAPSRGKIPIATMLAQKTSIPMDAG